MPASSTPHRTPYTVAFIQPFGLGDPGGGSHLLARLLLESPITAVSIATCNRVPAETRIAEEVHIRRRPYFGRIEHTRAAGLFELTESLFTNSFSDRLYRACCQHNVVAIHLLAHGLEFLHAFDVARKLNIPFFLTIHDDLAYTSGHHHQLKRALKKMADLWNSASARFAISPELAELYCQRYGRQPYSLVTDGFYSAPARARSPRTKKLQVYFMGLVHLNYAENFAALLDALGRLANSKRDYEVSLTVRSGWFPNIKPPNGVGLTLLPFEASNPVLADMRNADLLYLPLPFAESAANFVRYSLSTKMVTYLNSGVPILYHGPREAAAAQLLARESAANCVFAPHAEEVFNMLEADPQLNTGVAECALRLARTRFHFPDILARFWTPIVEAVG